jgi:SRSO17 transposase
MQSLRGKTMEQMSFVVPDSNYQAIQQFITDSGWDYKPVMNRVAQIADELIGDETESCLIVDESGFRKKGKLSVGVARQWLGNIGKVDNGQVGVFAALCNGNRATLINGRLYLPNEWTTDKARCERAKVPLDDRTFKTKDDIALEMVVEARALGMRYGWVAADAGYGKGTSFCEELEDLGETFVVDIHSDLHVYQKNPQLYIPEDNGGRGRKPSRLITDEQTIRVDKFVAGQSSKEWKTVTLRDATNGPLVYEVLNKMVWVASKESGKTYHWHLIVRRNALSGEDYKYSLCNADTGVSLQRLAFMQGQRFWIERAFEDCKGNCGMADYEVRSWLGWHHHMAMVMIAELFMLKERTKCNETHPLLSCTDIEEMLEYFLPRKKLSPEEFIQSILKRHQIRQALIDAAEIRARKKMRKTVNSILTK